MQIHNIPRNVVAYQIYLKKANYQYRHDVPIATPTKTYIEYIC